MVQRIMLENSDTRHGAFVGDLYTSFNNEALGVLSFNRPLHNIIHSQGRNRAVHINPPGSSETEAKHIPALTL